jgi:hypothetical protein
MHGHARLVERKIRLWIVQQEFNRQKEGQLVQTDARGDGPHGPSGAASMTAIASSRR